MPSAHFFAYMTSVEILPFMVNITSEPLKLISNLEGPEIEMVAD